MAEEPGYWTNRALPRRALLRGIAAGGGALALGLAGCGGRTSSQPPPSAGKAGGATATRTALDPTKGKPGGTLRVQGAGNPGSLVLARSVNQAIAQQAGFTHSGLLELLDGTPAVPGDDVVSVGPDLAETMPEQPDEVTYRFKLKPARFQNGRPVTSEDVKYSFDRYAHDPNSGYRAYWVWLDTVETPDPQTAVVKTKGPYSEALGSMAARSDAFILAKEWEESPEAEKKLMGSGPFLFGDFQPPVLARYHKNPDYFQKPYPYFDNVELLLQTDYTKKVADFISRQVQMSYWHGEDDYDQIRRARPDAQSWRWPAPGSQIVLRCDQPPFNDKRVRQALSMAIDRKSIRDAVTKGRGEDDQVWSWTNRFWGFRKPSQLGAAAKYWEFNPQAAKQLLSAAGVTQPIEAPFLHWDASVIGQPIVDQSTLVQTHWRNAGLANMKDREITFAQFTTSVTPGNFDGVYLGPGGALLSPAFGLQVRGTYAWPEGANRPVTNNGHINDPELTRLLDKQVTQLNVEERKQTLRQIEDIFAEQQYRITLSTYFYNYFGDPSVKNMQVPILAFNSSIGYVKYWWFA